MKYNIIATGSNGNAVILNDCILIDCGVSFKALKPYYKKLQLVLLTHIHGDHFNAKTIGKLASERPTLRFGCCRWLVKSLLKAGVKASQIDIYGIEKHYYYVTTGFSVCPVYLAHDVENCGYRVFMGDKKAFYATDTVSLSGITAENYDLYLIEANHLTEEIKKRIKRKRGTGEFIYEDRVMLTHLCKEKADEFILANAGENSVYEYLHGHKGEEITVTDEMLPF